MTVANNYAPVVTAANGSTTVFSGSWNAISASNLVVQLLNTTTGVYTTVSQGVASNQYQVTSLTSHRHLPSPSIPRRFLVTMSLSLAAPLKAKLCRIPPRVASKGRLRRVALMCSTAIAQEASRPGR